MDDPRIAGLPKWARDHIDRLKVLPELLADEAATLRRKVAALEARCGRLMEQVEAMTEMFRCAAIGGSEGARHVVGILEGYEIFPSKKATVTTFPPAGCLCPRADEPRAHCPVHGAGAYS